MNLNFVPERTEQKVYPVLFPAVQIDSAFRILHVNEAAAVWGVTVGECLFPPASPPAEGCRLWHEACLRGGADSPLDPLSEESRHIRLRLPVFHGFRLADIVYSYTWGTTYATAILYPSPRYLMQNGCLFTGQPNRYMEHMQAYLSDLRQECMSLLQEDERNGKRTGQILEEILAASLFISRIPFSSTEAKRRFRLSFLLDTYLADVLPQLRPIDCRIVRTESQDSDISLPTDLTAMFLLWTMLFLILNDIADDRRICIDWNRYGADGEIRFSVHTKKLADLPAHIPSLSVLAPYLPSLRLPLDTADYLAGCLDCYLDMYPDKTAGILTFSLYIPEEKQLPDFKSPKESQTLLREAILCLRGLFRVVQKEPIALPEAAEE